MRAIWLAPWLLLAACPAPVCGNGEVEAGEACDDANDDPADGCDEVCAVNQCGDLVPQPGELCLSPQGGFFVAGDRPTLLRGADLDGDGDLDLLAASTENEQVSVRLNAGDGSFPALQLSPIGTGLQDLAIFDHNADGLADLVFAQPEAGLLLLAENLGDGLFAAPQEIDPGVGPLFVKAIDANNDGITDLLCDGVDLNSGGRFLSLLLGAADGSFAAPQKTVLAEVPFGFEATDLNQDQRLDLLVAFPNLDRVQIFLGQVDGSFFPLVAVNTGDQPERVILFDADNDGADDLIVSNRGSREITFHRQTGTADFANPQRFVTNDPPERFAVGELSGDAFPDLLTLVAGRMQVFAGVPGFPFAFARDLFTERPPQDLFLGDFDGDSQLDLAATQDTANAAVSPSVINVFLSRP
jgi:cysteine-rich repeat protein